MTIDRYQVTWHLKGNTSELIKNRRLAFGRLRPLVNKIQKQPDLVQRNNDVIQDQLDRGIVKKVEHGTCNGIQHYVPHHVIIKPQKSTTILRVAAYHATQEHRLICSSVIYN